MHIFTNFKSFLHAELDLFKPVTFLIGKNGSGKTNAIEAVELLANIAHGRPLYEIADVGRGPGVFEVRGGLAGCPRRDGDNFSLGFSGGIRFLGSQENFRYSVTVHVRPEPRISNEFLTIGERHIFTADLYSPAAGSLLRVTYDNFARGGNKPYDSLSTERSVLSRYRSFTADLEEARGDRYKDARHVVGIISNYLRSSFVFDPNPKAMRAYERIGQRMLSRDGGNLSSVLHGLESGNEENKAALQRILESIKQLPEEPFESFGFVVTSQGDVLFGLRNSESAPVMDARVLSDGTLRSLAVLTALETVEAGSRIVIEEFDNGVHPTRVGVLANALWECSKRRKLNVLVTTHNPATLDALTEEQLGSTVLCVFDSAMQCAQIVPLMSVPQSDVLLERGHLGDLVTRKVLERHLMPNFKESQRKIATEWLESLK